MEGVLEYMLYGDKSSFPDGNTHIKEVCRLAKNVGADCSPRSTILPRPENDLNSTLHSAPYNRPRLMEKDLEYMLYSDKSSFTDGDTHI